MFLLASVKFLPNSENPFTTPLQRPFRGDFDYENASGSPCGPEKIVPEKSTLAEKSRAQVSEKKSWQKF
jgi:hypothetical protein